MSDTWFEPSGELKDEYLGRVCPGIGVGVVILGTGHFPELGDLTDGHLRFLMGRRGPLRSPQHPGGVRNEPDCWDIPGGGVNMGQRLEDVVRREVAEELVVVLDKVTYLFHIEHFPPGQHWVSHTHAATIALPSFAPRVPEAEQEKCVELRYFTLAEALALPDHELSLSMRLNLPRLRHHWSTLYVS